MELRSLSLSAEEGDAFPAPPIHIFSQWVKDVAYKSDLLNGKAAARSVDSQHIREVWAQAIQASRPELASRECYALAKQARAADRLVSQWLDEPDPNAGAGNWQEFLQWRVSAQKTMLKQNRFAAEQWLQHFCTQLLAGEVAASLLPETIQLTGFVEITRLEKKVLDALGEVGVRYKWVELPAAGATKTSVRHFTSLEQELGCMARWARSELELGKQRVAIVINGLEGLRETVCRVFEDTFEPGSVLGLGDFSQARFHISKQQSLASHPVVAEALLLLDVSVHGVRQALEFPSISRFLLSSRWLGADGERFARASLELRIREKGWYRLSLAALAGLAGQHPLHESLPLLIDRCGSLKSPSRVDPPEQQLLDWLAHWGWPGDLDLDETSLRAAAQFIGGFESLFARPAKNVNESLTQLRRYCEDACINAHGGAFSPLQIMSPDEAFGQQFDAIWAGNMTDDNWPGRVLSNPFIPPAVLAGIPRGTDAGVLQYTDRLMHSLAVGASQVTFSAAARYDDVPQSISPLLQELETEEISDDVESKAGLTLSLSVAPEAGGVVDYASHPWLQAHSCTRGLKLTRQESRPIRGIVERFNYQAACPLASYLVYRLHARMPAAPEPFADAAFRGKLVHTAMEGLYRPCLGSDIAPDIRSVPQVVTSALQAEFADTKLLPAAFEAEQVRLQNLLTSWLSLPDLKPGGRPFALEWRQQLSFAGFEFNVRIDRLDRLGDSRAFLIDYKSGNLGTGSAWCSARLGNVQLPLYAVALEELGLESPAGVALLQLKLGEFKVFGISEDAGAVCKGVQQPGVGRGTLAKQFSDWAAVMDFWRAGLALLAAEIHAGDCTHQLHNPDALKYADLEILLRNNELQQWCLERGQ